jgi:hypothetical protein
MIRSLMLGLLGSAAITTVSASEYMPHIASPSAQEELDAIGAPITTRSQLDAYLAVTPDSPIHRLGDEKMNAFLRSLVFVPRGVGSYSTVELEGLPSTDVYRILALFGLQSTVGSVRHRRAIDASDRAIEARVGWVLPPTRAGQACLVTPGGSSHICTPLDGSRCSYLCRMP